MNIFPNELGGTHPLASWGNKLLRAARASVVVSGHGYNATTTPAGTFLKIETGQDGITFPFKIVPGSTWLKFKVTTGYVITTGAPFVPTDVDTEFTLTSGVAKYYFLLTMTDATTAEISVSSTLPVWSVEIVPIGWVDTNTYSGSSRSVIYQFCRENIFSPCVVAA